jgi:hypothetical protein
MTDSQRPTPAFSVQMRGYDQREVDDFPAAASGQPGASRKAG